MITGACLCGEVSFTFSEPLVGARYCHCENCRKFSGTSPAAWAMGNTGAMQKHGDALVKRWNSGRGLRCFCSACGCPVWFESLDFPDIVAVPLGTIDQGEVPPPEKHLWMDSKPDWCVVQDNLPKHPNYPGEE